MSVIQNKTKYTGTVKWFNATKGYGFIAPEDGSKDIFVHLSAVTKSGMNGLRDGQRIAYFIEEANGKQSAVDLEAL